MTDQREAGPSGRRWAELRFAVVGPLLAAPPDRGELQRNLEQLALKTWVHPISGEPHKFSTSTIERWYYAAKNQKVDPIGALRRRIRKDAGGQPSLNTRVRALLRGQYHQHKKWSYQLHTDNLGALVDADVSLGPKPSYATVRRYLKRSGLRPVRRGVVRKTAGAQAAAERLETREVRSYESAYVLGLWHLDFHEGSRSVVTRDGTRVKPQCLCVMDDHSRLVCHIQWYLEENTEWLVHGLSQAIQKRGLPRSLMTDRGAAMMAGETQRGLSALSISHDPTLPYSPYQNAKQESFWSVVEGRLMAMLEGCEELTLDMLNDATQAWVEFEHNREVHSELGVSPMTRFLGGKSVGRDSPESAVLRRAFCIEETRSQRRSDGTLSIAAKRFEVPNRYRNLDRVTVRYARWDLRFVDLVDGRSGQVLCVLRLQDKVGRGDGYRAMLDPAIGSDDALTQPMTVGPAGIAPLLRKLMADYASTGLPPPYIPVPDSKDPLTEDDLLTPEETE